MKKDKILIFLVSILCLVTIIQGFTIRLNSKTLYQLSKTVENLNNKIETLEAVMEEEGLLIGGRPKSRMIVVDRSASPYNLMVSLPVEEASDEISFIEIDAMLSIIPEDAIDFLYNYGEGVNTYSLTHHFETIHEVTKLCRASLKDNDDVPKKDIESILTESITEYFKDKGVTAENIRFSYSSKSLN